MLEKLEKFGDVNNLKINTAKTKIIILRKGKHPDAAKFVINGKEIEIVGQFRYLGVVFTPQLKFYAHVDLIIKKIKAKIRILFAKTTIRDIKLEICSNFSNVTSSQF